MATFLDQQERVFFWYRNRARHDYYVQSWKRGRIYADFIFTLKPDDPDAADPFHQVFVVETKGLHPKEAADTEYKRSVFDICSQHATRRNWAEFVPAMRGKAASPTCSQVESLDQAFVTVLPMGSIGSNVAAVGERDRLRCVLETSRPIVEALGSQPAQCQ